jgi:tetratricopeptide (TPR) repeat protein
VNRGVAHLDDFDERFRHPSPDTYLMRRVARTPLTDGEKRNLGLFHAGFQRGHPLLGYFLLEDYVSRHPGDEEVVRALIALSRQVDKPTARLRFMKLLVRLRPTDPRVNAEYGWTRFEEDMRSSSSVGMVLTDTAETFMRKAIVLSGDTVDTYRARLADMFYRSGRFALAMDQYARALEIREIHDADPYIPQDQLLTQLALCLYETGQRSRALGYALQAVNANPANQQARSLILKIWDEGTGTPNEQQQKP